MSQLPFALTEIPGVAVAGRGAVPSAAGLTVGIDVSSLAVASTGIARYTAELVGGLQSALPPGSLVVLGNRRPPHRTDAEAGVAMPVVGPRFPSRAAWTFGILPLWLRRAGLDVFHGTAYFAPLTTDVPAVVTFHDLSTFAHPELHPRARVLRARATFPLIARRAAAVIVPSRQVADDVVRWLGVPAGRVHLIAEAPAEVFARPVEPHVVRAALDHYGLEPGFFLALGALEPRKNLARILAALELLWRNERLEPARLVIVGPEGWKSASFDQALRRSSAPQRIRRLGFVPDADVRALMAAARGLVYPSLYEGFGLPVVEAMAGGLPVVTSNEGALRELADGAALLVDPADPAAIARAMRGLMEDPETAAQLAALGRERASGYRWSRVAAETLTVYRAAIERGRP